MSLLKLQFLGFEDLRIWVPDFKNIRIWVPDVHPGVCFLCFDEVFDEQPFYAK